MDSERRRIAEEAGLDDRAAATVAELDDATVAALAQAWDSAVQHQDSSLHEAVDGALGMLPRLLRRQVLKVLGAAIA